MAKRPLIIGISGKIGTGKDTYGGFIEVHARELGYLTMRRAFGDALKEEAALFLSKSSFEEIAIFLEKMANPQDRQDILDQTFYIKPKGFWDTARMYANILAHGHPLVKDYRGQYDELLRMFNDRYHKEKFRRLLQWWGTDYRRKQCDDGYWLTQIANWIAGMELLHPGVKLLIWVPDNRFPNEELFLENIGAYTIRVERPSSQLAVKPAARNHISETALDSCKSFHEIVLNEKLSLILLKQKARASLNKAIAYHEANK